MTAFATILIVALALALIIVWGHLRQRRREAFIRETLLPPGLLDALIEPFPHLALKDRQLVARGLRKFFLAQVRAGKAPVAMPSRVVGALWAAFAGREARYRQYCRQAIGRVLPATPAACLTDDRATNAALRRCWWHACREENLNPRKPTRLPLLFALDAKLKIEHGYYYFTDDFARRRRTNDGDWETSAGDGDGGSGESDWSFERRRSYTPDDLQDPSIDGSTDGFGDSGGGDGGGDGGGGGD
jgi:hypothetical protein